MEIEEKEFSLWVKRMETGRKDFRLNRSTDWPGALDVIEIYGIIGIE
jgi:hypothetical protein